MPNSSDGLIFVKIRAKDGLFLQKIRALYGENTDKILVHVQSVIDLFAKQLNNVLNLHYVYHPLYGRFSTNARKYRRAPIYSGDMATLGGGCGC